MRGPGPREEQGCGCPVRWRPEGAWPVLNCTYRSNKGWEMPNNCVIGSIYSSILINSFNYRCNKLSGIYT